uniref:Glutamate receptor n=1 Tax=Elaeis guineensis var. tenera TaxID=51953 RepID=A0A6I9S1E8_ELAGV|nr:glutamate receptor 2.1-like [Elaeis guineensis]
MRIYIHLSVLLLSLSHGLEWANANGGSTSNSPTTIDVGVILDMGSWIGNISWSCISMAIDDFYAAHPNYSTRLVPHRRNSGDDVVSAASAALDLINNARVQAIIGLQTSLQAKFVAELGTKAQVPIISFSATCPYLSSPRTPYFVRTALNDSTQATAIAGLIHSFAWREVIPIFENSDYGNGILSFLNDALQEIGAHIPHSSMISVPATDDRIQEELLNLKTRRTRVFIVHVSHSLAYRLFLKAKEADMMSEGYAWIMTYGSTAYLNLMDSSTIDAMQGVLSINPYVHESKKLDNFKSRWKKRFYQENPSVKAAEPGVFGLWAYDTVWALAMAVESAGMGGSINQKPNMANSTTDWFRLGFSSNGPKLLELISNTKLSGVSGKFHLVDGQLELTGFEIINVIGSRRKRIGFWTSGYGITKSMDFKASLSGIVWPGDTMIEPKGLDWQTSKQRIGIPVKSGGFSEFINQEWNPLTKRNASGFSIEVFDMVMASLPYAVPYEYIPYADAKGRMKGSYDDLVYEVYLKNFDAVVGDVTITTNRSVYVDFTAPYTEMGMSMVVPIKNDRKSAMFFFKPLTTSLWLVSGAFFIFIGFVVWALEHGNNEEFKGPLRNQVGTVFYFSFSTLVFAHREKLLGNFTRVVVVVWVFVVFILTSSYTASLSSVLTVQQSTPVTDVNEIIRNGGSIGYMGDSSMLGQWKIHKSKLKAYNSTEEYDGALSKGSSEGGVSAIIAEIPCIEVFLSKLCHKYVRAGPVYRTDGFGFVFPKGSPLVPDISIAILKMTGDIEQMLYRNRTFCPNDSSMATSEILSLDDFWGLFLTAGILSTAALAISMVCFVYDRWHFYGARIDGTSISGRLVSISKLYGICSSFAIRKSEQSVLRLTDEGNAGCHNDDAEQRSPSSPSDRMCGNSGQAEGTTERDITVHIQDQPASVEIVDETSQ